MLRFRAPLRMIARSDVKFLSAVVDRLEAGKLSYYRPHENRNAYAMILRFKGAYGLRVARMFSPHEIRDITPREVLAKLERDAVDDEDPDTGVESALTLFFMRQKHTAEHRWSSVVTFPGGKRDDADDRDDRDCVRRYAYDLLGIPLKGDFVCLGRMPDTWTFSRDLNRGVMSARFVYLHIGDMTPTLKLANHVVASAAWVPLKLLTPQNVRRDRVKHLFYSYLRYGTVMHEELRNNFSNSMMYFPCVPLPGELGAHFGDVWGSTLSWASTLLVYGGRARLDWPIVQTQSFVLQNFVILPMHGALELIGHEAAEGVRRSPKHIVLLAHLVGWLAFLVGSAGWYLYIICWVLYDAWTQGGGHVSINAKRYHKAMEEAEDMKERNQAANNMFSPGNLSQAAANAAAAAAGVVSSSSSSSSSSPSSVGGWLRRWLPSSTAAEAPDATIGARTEGEYRDATFRQKIIGGMADMANKNTVPEEKRREHGTVMKWSLDPDDEDQQPVVGTITDPHHQRQLQQHQEEQSSSPLVVATSTALARKQEIEKREMDAGARLIPKHEAIEALVAEAGGARELVESAANMAVLESQAAVTRAQEERRLAAARAEDEREEEERRERKKRLAEAEAHAASDGVQKPWRVIDAYFLDKSGAGGWTGPGFWTRYSFDRWRVENNVAPNTSKSAAVAAAPDASDAATASTSSGGRDGDGDGDSTDKS